MLAPSGQSESLRLCPLLEQQRTTHRLVAKSANDQSGRTLAGKKYSAVRLPPPRSL